MGYRELSIIQYQNVSKAPHIHKLWLSPEAFKKQLDHISQNNFQVISIDDAIDYMEGKKSIKGSRPISLTFDNGFRDFYEQVYPALSDYNFTCAVLISPLKVGKSVSIEGRDINYLTWDNLKKLTGNNITIGAYEDHAWNINDVPKKMIQRHITDYKRLLEDRLGLEIRYFGVKEGIPNQKIRDLLISEGYRAFLTQSPTNRSSDLFSIGRIQVDDDDFNIFLTKISRIYLFFKDKRSWKYIRKYSLDKIAHKLSETFDSIRGVKTI